MKKVLLLAVLAISTGAFAQKLSNKLNYQKGKYEVVTELKKTSTMELMGQSMETNVNSNSVEMLDVEDVSATGAKVEHKMKKLSFTVEGMGKTESFDSEKEEDRKGEIGKSLEKSLKNKYTMYLDETGKVVKVVADDSKTVSKDEEDGLGGIISNQLGIDMAVPKEGGKSLFKVLPEREITVGDSWTDTATLAEGVKTSSTYKVTGMTDTEVTLDGTEENKIAMTQQNMGMEFTVNMTDKFTGKIILDRKTGLLKEKSGTVESSGTVEGQGMNMPTSGKTTIKTTIRKID